MCDCVYVWLTTNWRSSMPMVIEGGFGRLNGWWGLLIKLLDSHLSPVPNHVSAACILHDICEALGVDTEDDMPAGPRHTARRHTQNEWADLGRQDRVIPGIEGRARDIHDIRDAGYIASNRLPWAFSPSLSAPAKMYAKEIVEIVKYFDTLIRTCTTVLAGLACKNEGFVHREACGQNVCI